MKKNGFTLIEVLITIIVIGLLLVISMPLINNINEQATEKAKKIFYSNIKSSALTYASEFNNNVIWAPNDETDLSSTIEFACIPISYLNEKGYIKEKNLVPPGEKNSIIDKFVKIERDLNTKVISNESIDFNSEQCQINYQKDLEVRLDVVSSSGVYKYTDYIEVTATFNENIEFYDEPVLIYKFGDGENKRAQFESLYGNKITYKIIVDVEDLDKLNLVSYTGYVFDKFNNILNIDLNSESSLGGNIVSASTKARINESYYTTLANTINNSVNDDTIYMVNNTNECVQISDDKKISLDLNGRKVTCDNGDTILNYGNLIISDSLGNGEVVASNGNGINNASSGVITVKNAIIKGYVNGIYNSSGIVNVGVSTDTFSIISPAIYSIGGSGYAVYTNSGGTLNFYNGALYTANTNVTTAYYKNNCALVARLGYRINNTTTTIDGNSYVYSHLINGSTVLQYRYRDEDCERECIEYGECSGPSGSTQICVCEEWGGRVCEYGSWSSWSTSNPGNRDQCQKRTCNLDVEGNITTCGSSSSYSC